MPAKSAPARTRRTRKTSSTASTPTVTTKVIPTESVTKYTHTPHNNKVTETPTPSKVRPEKPNLSRKDYMDDIKIRWQIHQWEVNEAWEDTKKGYHFVKPYLQKGWNYSLELYALVAKQVKALQEDKPETNQLTN